MAAVGNTAIGNGAIAIGTNAVAFGEASTAAAAGATAIGRGASVVAGATNAVAIGHGSLASAPNTVSFGSPGNERRLTNVAAGVAPTDAATVGQLSSVSAGFQSQIAGLQTELTATRREARAGAALALAATGLQYDPRPGRASLAAAFGHYKDQAGLAVGIGYAVSDRLRINAAFTGAPDVSDYGVVAGASFTLN
ncbi:YadA-like family protein [Rhodoplanes elegans]|uniref:YadA-like family protein n=1 Tax=Rhodoplanes elegans TaxID=29408 RepID=UPI00308413A3